MKPALSQKVRQQPSMFVKNKKYFLILLFILTIFGISLTSAGFFDFLFGSSSNELTETITYTENSKTICDQNGVCKLIQYSGPVFGKNSSGEWVNASDLFYITKNSDDITFHYNGEKGYFNLTLEAGVIYNGNYFSMAQVKQLQPNIEFNFPSSKQSANHKYSVNITNLDQTSLNLNLIDAITLTYKNHYGFTLDQFKNSDRKFFINNIMELAFDDLTKSLFTFRIVPLERRLYMENITSNIKDGTLYLDPTIQLKQTADFEDTHIRSAAPTTNYGTTGNEGIKTYNEGTAWYKSLIRIDLDNNVPNGAIITQCDLNLYETYSSGTFDVAVHRATKSWVENEATWNNYATGNAWETAGASGSTDINTSSQDVVSVGASGSFYTWDLMNNTGSENLCQKWLDGDYDNEGVLLKVDVSSGYRDKSYHASEYTTDLTLRPYLNITYTNPTICTGGECELDYRFVESDVYYGLGIFGQDDMGTMMKWDLSPLCEDTSYDSIDSAKIQMYITAKSGSPDSDARFWYIRNQTWDEQTPYGELDNYVQYNQTDTTFSSTTSSTLTNLTITTLVKEACGRGDKFMTLRFEDPDYLVNSAFSGKNEGTTVKTGNGNLFSGASYTMASRTHATTSYRPKLFISYTTTGGDNPPTVTLSTPANNTQSTNTNYLFQCNVTDDINIKNITFYSWNSTGEFNVTSNLSNSLGTSSNVTFNISNFEFGESYDWNCYACDNATTTQCAWATNNWTLTIETPFNLYVNETSSDTNFTKTDEASINVQWYSNPSVNVDTCFLELNNGTSKTNYTGTASSNYCNVTINDLEGLNWTYVAWANNSNGEWENAGEYWVYINLDPTGYWVMRAPVNSTNLYTGESKARRWGGDGAPLGNGRDVGVLWRNDTLDDDGRLHGEEGTDEERHCGAWTQFFFDEIGYDNGTIENLYCHMWMYTEDTSNDYGQGVGQEVVGVGINGDYTSGSYYHNIKIIDSPSYPKNATKYTLMTYWHPSLNLDYNDDYNFTGISFKGSGELVQMMSYRNQRSFCIVNVNTSSWTTTDSDGDGLNDSVEMNITFTDPYDTDTDDDGHDDYQEWANNKSGIDPYDWGDINIIRLDGAINKAYLRERNNQSTWLAPAYYTNTLDREFTTAEYENLTYHDSDCPLFADCTNATIIKYYQNTTNHFSHTQINYYYNISSIVGNLSNINNLNMFYGGILISQNNYDATSLNKTLTILNIDNSSNSAIVPAKPGHTNAFYLKQIKNNITDYINESDGRLWVRAETSNADSSSDITFGWTELWVITGKDELNITSPTNATYSTINESDILLFNFTFKEDGEEIINGVTFDNITIDGNICSDGGNPIYADGVWQGNCTVPCIETTGEYMNLSITASSSTETITGVNEDAVFYQSHGACDTCTYSGSGNWFVNCADNCTLSTPVSLGGNNITINGTGKMILSSIISDFDRFFIQGTSETERCFVYWMAS